MLIGVYLDWEGWPEMNAEPNIKTISIDNLLIDLQNPRYDPRTNQREAITTIANDQGIKLANLAEDMVEKGLNPSELPMVTPSGDKDTFVVVEGNRRITALKLLLSPSLSGSIGLPDSLAKRFKALHDEAKDILPKQLTCAVLPREDANHWIFIRHTGENQGVGVVPWDGIQTYRFRGSSPALQAVELVRSSDYLDETTRKRLPKIAITNIERILGTPDAREFLGVDVKAGRLIFVSDEEGAIARLALVVSDIANKRKKVTDLDTKQQRVEYARDVSTRPLPKQAVGAAGGDAKTGADTTSGSAGASHSIPHDRKTLIPKRLKLVIPQIRLNKIYHELQQLNVDKYLNSCSVMLRVFVELTLDSFAQRHKIPFQETIPAKRTPNGLLIPPREREFSLREKLSTVVGFMEEHDICSKEELRGVRTIITNRDHVLSVDSLNAYVHNKDFNPTPTDLKATWDNLQIFIERSWAI
jgi:hypothetical protein